LSVLMSFCLCTCVRTTHKQKNDTCLPASPFPFHCTTDTAAADVKTEIKPETEDTTDPNTTVATNTTNTTSNTTGSMNTWLDRSRSSNSLENAKNPDSYATEENKTLKKGVDIVPTSMRLMTGKGQDIMPNYVIQNEVVFEEEVTEEGEDDEERVNEYFTFNKGRK